MTIAFSFNILGCVLVYRHTEGMTIVSPFFMNLCLAVEHCWVFCIGSIVNRYTLFWCVYTGQDGFEVCKLEANMQPSLPNKFGQQRIYHVFKGNFSCGMAACLEWVVKILSNILPTWVANHIGVFDSSQPLMDPKPYKTYIMWICQ